MLTQFRDRREAGQHLAGAIRVPAGAPVRVLAVRGESFELGEGMSPDAAAHLQAAWPKLASLCAAGDAETRA